MKLFAQIFDLIEIRFITTALEWERQMVFRVFCIFLGRFSLTIDSVLIEFVKEKEKSRKAQVQSVFSTKENMIFSSGLFWHKTFNELSQIWRIRG